MTDKKIGGPFAARTYVMLKSPAMRVLSLAAHRILMRIEIELGNHGGKDNGRLIVTYTDFVSFGMDRHAIGPALRELEALGFITITEHGCSGNGRDRTPNRFRLTYHKTTDAPATNDWLNITSIEQADQRARAARGEAGVQRRVKKAQISSYDEFLPVGVSPPPPVGVSPPLAKKPNKRQWEKPPLLSRMSSHLEEAEAAKAQPRPQRPPTPIAIQQATPFTAAANQLGNGKGGTHEIEIDHTRVAGASRNVTRFNRGLW
jgi:hypothetical protein